MIYQKFPKLSALFLIFSFKSEIQTKNEIKKQKAQENSKKETIDGITYYNDNGSYINGVKVATGEDLDLLVVILTTCFPELDSLISKIDYVFEHLNEDSTEVFSLESLDVSTAQGLVEILARIDLDNEIKNLAPAQLQAIFKTYEAMKAVDTIRRLYQAANYAGIPDWLNAGEAHRQSAYQFWMRSSYMSGW